MTGIPYLTMVNPDMFICPYCSHQHVMFYAEAEGIYNLDFLQRVDRIVAWLVSNEIETNPQKARDLAIISATLNISREQETQGIKRTTPTTVPSHEFMHDGFVYFVRVPGGDRVKIGFSANVKKRLQALSTHMGQPLDVLLVLPGTKDEERYHHEKWSYARKRGEWFEEDDELRIWINLRAKDAGFIPYRIG